MNMMFTQISHLGRQSGLLTKHLIATTRNGPPQSTFAQIESVRTYNSAAVIDGSKDVEGDGSPIFGRPPMQPPPYRLRNGNREIVGPSFSGMEDYYDRVDQPCPPIRFKPPINNGLREKEKESWKSLTIDEKKKLYRMSFCQTFAEMEAPTCQGRRIFGTVLMILSAPILLFAVAKKTIFPPLPDSLSDQGKKRLVRWYIDSRADPLDGGISSKWDYEKNQWKEKPYLLMRSK